MGSGIEKEHNVRTHRLPVTLSVWEEDVRRSPKWTAFGSRQSVSPSKWRHLAEVGAWIILLPRCDSIAVYFSVSEVSRPRSILDWHRWRLRSMAASASVRMRTLVRGTQSNASWRFLVYAYYINLSLPGRVQPAGLNHSLCSSLCSYYTCIPIDGQIMSTLLKVLEIRKL